MTLTLREIEKKQGELQEYATKLNQEREKLLSSTELRLETLLEYESLEKAIEEATEAYYEIRPQLAEINRKLEIVEALREKLTELRQKKLSERQKLVARIVWLKSNIRDQEIILSSLKNSQTPDRVSEAARKEKIRIAEEQLQRLHMELARVEKALDEYDKANGR